MSYSDVVANNLGIIDKETPEGEAVRARVGAMLRDIGNHGKFYGRELDQRFKSDIVVRDPGVLEEPIWDPRQYTPSTWPGARAPHVWLKDGPTPIFDNYGSWWTLIGFGKSGEGIAEGLDAFAKAAEKLELPLKTVELTDEHHARKLWEMDFVLVRPDGHVTWRGDDAPSTMEIVQIIEAISGRKPLPSSEHSLKNGHT
jgi:FAD-dependent monooxygenase